jgi:hypothetical protein
MQLGHRVVACDAIVELMATELLGSLMDIHMMMIC